MSQPIDALPALNPALVPAEVRKGTREDQQAYRAALGFERMLVLQLARSLNATAEGDGAGEDSGEGGLSAVSSAYRDMLPDAMADGVIAGGGLGLAPELYRTLRQGKEEGK